jgi:hypothetical protein
MSASELRSGSTTLYGRNLANLRELASDVTAPTEVRITAMCMIREFEQIFQLTFGVEAKIE